MHFERQYLAKCRGVAARSFPEASSTKAMLVSWALVSEYAHDLQMPYCRRSWPVARLP
jgi:hypothetical protein